jgi:hypothetical protein
MLFCLFQKKAIDPSFCLVYQPRWNCQSWDQTNQPSEKFPDLATIQQSIDELQQFIKGGVLYKTSSQASAAKRNSGDLPGGATS